MDDVEIKKLVGKKIKYHRKALKLSQFELGEKIEINQRQIAQIECGKSFPSLSTLNKLSKALNCDLRMFFEYNSFKPSSELRDILKQFINDANDNQLHNFYMLSEIVRNLS